MHIQVYIVAGKNEHDLPDFHRIARGSRACSVMTEIIPHDFLGPWAIGLNRRHRLHRFLMVFVFSSNLVQKSLFFAHFWSFGATAVPQAPAKKQSSWHGKQGVQMPFRRQHREGPYVVMERSFSYFFTSWA